MLTKATLRNNEWEGTVAKRVNSILYLTKQKCAITWIVTPIQYSHPHWKKKIRCLENENIVSAFKCQFSFNELMRRLEENLPSESPVSETILRKKLQEEYGDGVIFASR